MKDKIHNKFSKVISPEIKYMHLMETIEEAQRKFLKASKKGETFKISGKGQARLLSKKWK